MNAQYRLKVMKKNKIKKTKANMLSGIHEQSQGKNYGEKFKRNIIASKHQRQNNPKNKINPINMPSEDDR